VLCLLVLSSITILLTIHPFDWLASFMGLMELDETTTTFRYTLLLFPLVNLIVSMSVEVPSPYHISDFMLCIWSN